MLRAYFHLFFSVERLALTIPLLQPLRTPRGLARHVKMNKPSPLLSLPLELRTMIWGLVLSHHKSIRHLERPASELSKAHQIYTEARKRLLPQLFILFVNRQTLLEAQQALLENNTISIPMHWYETPSPKTFTTIKQGNKFIILFKQYTESIEKVVEFLMSVPRLEEL